jgi:hypothetical protein
MEMPKKNDKKGLPSKTDDRVLKGSGIALAELYKALKALSFYPESHPLREEILLRAFQALSGLMLGNGLSLIVHRTGLSFADRDASIESTRMTIALAKELFSREIQRLTLLSDVSLSDFTIFLSLLAQEPQRIIAEGGVEKILRQSGITTIFANEINIAAVFTKRASGESAETVSADGTFSRQATGAGEGECSREASTADASVGKGDVSLEGIPLDRLDDLSVAELSAMLEKEPDDSRYVQLARLLANKCCSLKEDGDFDPLFPVLLGLLNQNADETRSVVRREASMEAFCDIARGAMLEHLLDHLEDESFNQKEIVYLVLHHLGNETAEAVIPRLVASDCPFAKKALTTALLRIGPSAIPSLLTFLKDGRWQVVRTAAAVLGEMGCRDAVKGLVLTAYHVDTRVRIESIRSLAGIGGKEATDVLVDLLRDDNRAVRRQVILWLGVTKNESALQPLLDLVMERDFRGKLVTLKKEALLAIGRIGNPQALDTLFRLVEKKHFLATGRWDELKILTLETIGRLGGAEVKDFLRKIASRGGRVGRASSAVLETMEEGVTDEHD